MKPRSRTPARPRIQARFDPCEQLVVAGPRMLAPPVSGCREAGAGLREQRGLHGSLLGAQRPLQVELLLERHGVGERQLSHAASAQDEFVSMALVVVDASVTGTARDRYERHWAGTGRARDSRHLHCSRMPQPYDSWQTVERIARALLIREVCSGIPRHGR